MRTYLGRQLGIPAELAAHIPVWVLLGCIVCRRIGLEGCEARLMGVAVEYFIAVAQYPVPVDHHTYVGRES